MGLGALGAERELRAETSLCSGWSMSRVMRIWKSRNTRTPQSESRASLQLSTAQDDLGELDEDDDDDEAWEDEPAR